MRTRLIVQELLGTHENEDDPVTAAANQSWRWQLRDKDGQWIEMGSKVKWLNKGVWRYGKIVGSPKSGTATVEDNETHQRVSLTTNRLTAQEKPSATKQKGFVNPRTQRSMKGVQTIRAYPNAKRTPDGRMILRPDQMADFKDSTGPHSMLAFVEDAYDANGNKVKVLSKERELLHDKLVRQAIFGVKPSKSGEATFTYIGGGPGAGKSTATKQIAGFPKVREFLDINGEPGNAVLVDGDAIKLSLPEWGQPDKEHAAGFTHEESSIIAKATADVAMARKLDVVLDGTGDGSASKMGGKIYKARKNGYKVNGVYVTVSAGEALVRSLERSIEAGRYMPIQPLLDIHRDVVATVQGVRGTYDRFDLFDTDIPFGDPAIPVVADNKTVDTERYDAFVAKKFVTDLVAYQEALRIAEGKTYRKIKNKETGEWWPAERVKEFTLSELHELISDYSARVGREQAKTA